MKANLHVLVFGSHAQSVGRERLDLTIDLPTSVLKLQDALEEAYPVLSDALPASRFAVNLEYAEDATLIDKGDEVALIGPVSGG